MGARPRWLSAAFVHRGGLRDQRAAQGRGRHVRGRRHGRGRDRHRRHQSCRPRSRRRPVRHDRRHRRHSFGPAAGSRPRRARRPRSHFRDDRRSRDGSHVGQRRPRPRGGAQVRHGPGDRARRGLVRGCPLDALAAGPDPRRSRDRLQRTGPRHGPRRGVGRIRSAHQSCCRRELATCSGSILCMSPTKASSWRSLLPSEADAALEALRSHPLGAEAVRSSATSAPSLRASSCSARPSGERGSSTCWSAIRCRGSASARERAASAHPSAGA